MTIHNAAIRADRKVTLPGVHYPVRNDSGPSLAEVALVINNLGKSFEAFKAQNDRELAEVKAKGSADVVSREHTERINAEITRVSEEIKNLNIRVEASRIAGNGMHDKRSPERRAYDGAFATWFRRGSGEHALSDLAIKAALTTDSNPDGGYVVPEEMDSTITRVLGVVSTIRSIARVQPVGSVTFKKLHGLGGATSGWVGERAARTETNTPELTPLEFPTFEIYANPATTQQLLDDANMDAASWLASEVAITFAEQEGSAFWSGNGVNKPRGISSYTKVADASYAWNKTGYIVTGAAADFASTNPAHALIELQAALKAGYRPNAKWLMNSGTEAKVRKFVDTTGQYLWQPTLQLGAPNVLLGKEVVIDDNVDTVAANVYPVAYGDFQRGYIITDRVGARVLRDPYTNKPYVHFYTTKRVGGGIQDFAAIKLLKCST